MVRALPPELISTTLAMFAGDQEIVINVGVGAVFGILCAVIASGRGRSPLAWFVLGLLFSCISLVLLLVLPDLKQQDAHDQRQRLETRRLREQLAKERQIADQRHNQTERRLGVHDQALGVDTSTPPALTGSTEPPRLPDGPQWFYARGKERMGPVSAETIRHLLQAAAISGQTLLWREGMADWQAAERTDEFREDVA
jgi:hypothetical protein